MSRRWIREVVLEDDSGERYYADEYEAVLESREIRSDKMRPAPQRVRFMRLKDEPIEIIGRTIDKRSDGTYVLLSKNNKVVREVSG